MSDDLLPASLDHLALKRLADAQERTADVLQSIFALMQKQANGEIEKKGYHGKKKPPEVWVECSKQCVLLARDKLFAEWKDIKNLPAFREDYAVNGSNPPTGANMTREHQWRWFLRQHAVPRTPEYGDTHLVALGEADKNGPAACTIEGYEHCAKRAYAKVPENAQFGDSGPIFDPQCKACQVKKEREEIEKAIRDRAKLEAIEQALLDPSFEPRQRERMESERRWLRRDLEG